MNTISKKAVIEFTAKMTRNAELIFSAPTFELEEGLVLIKRLTNKKQDKAKNEVFDIVFNEETVGELIPIPKEENNSIGQGSCRVILYDHAFAYGSTKQVLTKFIASENSLLKIINLDIVNMESCDYFDFNTVINYCLFFQTLYSCSENISPQIVENIKWEIEFLLEEDDHSTIYDQLENVKTGLSLAIKYDLVIWYSEQLECYQLSID